MALPINITDLVSGQAKTNDNKGIAVLENLFSKWSDQVGNLTVQIIVSEIKDKVLAILNFLTEAKRRVRILEHFGLTNHSFKQEKYLDSLIKLGWLEMTIPKKTTHRDQKYKGTI